MGFNVKILQIFSDGKYFAKFLQVFEKFDNFYVKMEAMNGHPLGKTYFLFWFGRP